MSENYQDLKQALETLRADLIEWSSESVTEFKDKEEDIQLIKDLFLCSAQKKTLLVTRWDINHCHGTGILLSQIFNAETCIILKNNDYWMKKGGPGPFKSYQINVEDKPRPAIFSLMLDVLAKEKFDRIVCVPAHKEEYIMGIAAKYILNLPLVVWVMDEFLTVEKKLAAEFFNLADIVFVISAEMRDYYEACFQQKFYVLPPTVKSDLLGTCLDFDYSHNLAEKICIMVGNVWARPWLESLFRMVEASEWSVHWYGIGSKWDPLKTSPEELRKHRIIERGYLPQDELSKLIATYPFAIIPTGSGEEDDTAKGVTLFSLPSRLPFLLAVAHIPILLIGNVTSCAAKFVHRFGIGLTVDYEEKAFREALHKLSERKFLAQCAAHAAQAAALFSDAGLEEWIWHSCEKRRPSDDRFEKAFRRLPGNLAPYREDALPKDLEATFQPIYGSLNRLSQYGYQPDFFIDIGDLAETWVLIQRIFPQAHIISIKPEEMENATLETVLKQKGICGRGILKIDVQFTECLIARKLEATFQQVDIMILEFSLRPISGGVKTFHEMFDLIESLGFQYFDDARNGRLPVSGTLQRKEILFVNQRNNNCIFACSAKLQ